MPENFGHAGNPFPSPADMAGAAPHPMEAAGVQEWERTYAMFTHLTLLAYHFIPVPVVPALVMWLIKKDESAFIKDHGREVVNFHITLVIYGLISLPLVYACGIGLVFLLAAYVLGIVGMILGAVAANKGRFYRYPACLRLIG